jgi:tetratricopeptide (TPR) repeat protein
MNRKERRAARAAGSRRPPPAADGPAAATRLLAVARRADLPVAERDVLCRRLEQVGRLLALQPDHAEALCLLAGTAHQLGETRQAEALIDRALLLGPGLAAAHELRAKLLADAGRLDEAADAYGRLLVLTPGDPAAWLDLGNLHLRRAEQIPPHLGMDAACRHGERLNQAVAACQAALERQPHYPEALLLLGRTLLRGRREDKAAETADRALALRPGWPAAHHLRGLIAKRTGDMDGALRHLRRAAELAPEEAGIQAALAGVLVEAGRLDEAATAAQAAVTLAPNLADGHFMLGVACKDQGRIDEAEAAFKAALRVSPDHPGVLFARAEIALGHGDLPAGWALFENRFQTSQWPRHRFPPAPRWDGRGLNGGALLVWPEQGVGDEILFASCIPDATARAGRCIVECDRRLVSLFARSFPEATVRPTTQADDGSETIVPPDYAAQIPLCSLPLHLRRRREDFPARPWLVPDPLRVRSWRERLDGLGPGPKVGIAWRSGLSKAWSARFSSDLGQWREVFAVPGIRFVNLQYGPVEDELRTAETTSGVSVHCWPEVDLKDDLDGLAALIAALDLVIAPGISVSEMAAAVGARTWEFLPVPPELLEPRPLWAPWRRFFLRAWNEPWIVPLGRIAGELRRMAAGT